MVNNRALQMIEQALSHCLLPGKQIEYMALYVCPKSKIASIQYVHTRYGQLRIVPGTYIPQGLSYILEDSGRRRRTFSWVSKNSEQ